MANAGRAERPGNEPVDTGAERALIAAILIGNSKTKGTVDLAEIVKAIGKDDDARDPAFISEKCRTIYKHMRRLHLQKKPAGDATILMGSIRDAGDDGWLQEPGKVNVTTLVALMHWTNEPIWWNWRDYLARVVEMRKRRRRYHRAAQIITGHSTR